MARKNHHLRKEDGADEPQERVRLELAIGSLQGTAWKLVEDFDLEKTKEERAFKDILSMLDSAFQYDSEVEMPSHFSPPTSKPADVEAARPCCSSSQTMMSVFAAWRSMV